MLEGRFRMRNFYTKGFHVEVYNNTAEVLINKLIQPNATTLNRDFRYIEYKLFTLA